jgi:hypothetical protein
MGFRDRIKSLRRVKASELLANPKNWRNHPEKQRNALQGVLEEVGFADALLARELADGRLMLIDGHLRAEVAPDEKVPVLILDVTEEEADKLLVSIDPLAEMAETSQEKLRELLASMGAERKGFSDFLESMKASLPPILEEHTQAGGEEPAEDGGGLGEPVIKFEIVFDDDDQQQKWYGFLRHLRTSYPEQETHGARLASYIDSLELG